MSGEGNEERAPSVSELRARFQNGLNVSNSKPVVAPKPIILQSTRLESTASTFTTPEISDQELTPSNENNPFFRVSPSSSLSASPEVTRIPPVPPPIPASRIISAEPPLPIQFSKSNPPPRPVTRSRPNSAISVHGYTPSMLGISQNSAGEVQKPNLDRPSIPPRPPKPVESTQSLPILITRPIIPDRRAELAPLMGASLSHSPKPIPVISPKVSPKAAFAPLPPPRKLGAPAPDGSLSRRSSYAHSPHSPLLPPRTNSTTLQRSASQHSPSVTSSVPPPTQDYSTPYIPLPPPPSRAQTLAPLPIRRPSVLVSSKAKDSKGNDSSDSEEDDTKEDQLPDSSFADRTPPKADIKSIKTQGTFYGLAIVGKKALIGQHHFLIHDLGRGSSNAIGLPGGEHKIHAISLRNGQGKGEEEGRFAWGGTKDGHIFEIDTQELRITSVRHNIHPHSILRIFRLGNSLITLDESGKILFWGLPTASTPADINQKNPKAQRIPISPFAELINGYLWTSTGPNSKSNASALSSRSPQIRIYNPRSDAAAFALTPKPITTPLDAGMIGAVTAGTNSPISKLVYLAHETGEISIWDSFTCIRVQKVSINQITAMVGIGKYLWIGFKTGFIFIYDIGSPGTITVTKAWKAHDAAVTGFVVDPSGLWLDGTLSVASSGADSTIHFWDGFLRETFLAFELNKRQIDFCTFRSIRTLIVSWNIDSCKPSALAGTLENVEFLNQVLTSIESPDIISFGWQEVIDLESKSMTAKTLLRGNKSELSDSVSPSYRLWKDKLVQAILLSFPPESPYSLVMVQDMVGLFSCVFVKASERSGLKDVASQKVATGMAGFGNKGALLTRFVLDDTSICLINVHLAAGQKHSLQRNRDLVDILETKSAFSTSLSSSPNAYNPGACHPFTVFDHEIVILGGDLNYRIDEKRDVVITQAKNGNFEALLQKDQLLKNLSSNQNFRLRSFKEMPITFAPTYKYDPGTNDYDSSAKNRIPAWCDRVLYRCERDVFQPATYRRYEIDSSDHRPISMSGVIKVKKIIAEKRKDVWSEIELEWAVVSKQLLSEAWEYYGEKEEVNLMDI